MTTWRLFTHRIARTALTIYSVKNHSWNGSTVVPLPFSAISPSMNAPVWMHQVRSTWLSLGKVNIKTGEREMWRKRRHLSRHGWGNILWNPSAKLVCGERATTKRATSEKEGSAMFNNSYCKEISLHPRHLIGGFEFPFMLSAEAGSHWASESQQVSRCDITLWISHNGVQPRLSCAYL